MAALFLVQALNLLRCELRTIRIKVAKGGNKLEFLGNNSRSMSQREVKSGSLHSYARNAPRRIKVVTVAGHMPVSGQFLQLGGKSAFSSPAS